MKASGATARRKAIPKEGAAPQQTQRQIYLWSRLLIQFSPGVKNSRHRHFGAFLLLAPDAPVEVVVDPQHRVLGQAILVAPNTWHRLDSRGSRVATLVIGPDHPWFAYVMPALQGAVAVPFELSKLTGNRINWDNVFGGKEDCATIELFIHRALNSLSTKKPAPHVLDAKIATVIDMLHRNVDQETTPATLARAVGMTAFPLMRRFKRELGVRIREYVLWRRLIDSIPLFDGKRSLTEVAHLAGFYDQSHLTRTARRMFDLRPSSVTGPPGTRIHVCDGIKSASRPK